MKNNKLLILTIAIISSGILTAPVYGQQKKIFVIKGTLDNFVAIPGKIYLVYDDVYGKPIDSTLVKNNTYRFSGMLEFSAIAKVSFDKNAPSGVNTFPLMLDEGEVILTSRNNFANTEVSGKGSRAQHELAVVSGYAKQESLKIEKIRQTEGYSTNDSLQKIVRSQSTNLLLNALNNTVIYTRRNPTSPIAPFLSYTLITSGMVTPAMIDTLMSTFPEQLKKSALGLAIDNSLKKEKDAELEAVAKKKALEEKVPIGSIAADFSMNDSSGKMVSLSSFKGKYVLIDFWASWCKPCREENPNLVKAYGAYHKQGLEILGVSLDGSSQKAAWLAAIKTDGLSWTQVSDLKGFANEAATRYGVASIPQNFLIDPNGRVIARNLRGAELHVKLSEIFKK